MQRLFCFGSPYIKLINQILCLVSNGIGVDIAAQILLGLVMDQPWYEDLYISTCLALY